MEELRQEQEYHPFLGVVKVVEKFNQHLVTLKHVQSVTGVYGERVVNHVEEELKQEQDCTQSL